MAPRTYYQVLQVDPDASAEVIAAAYRSLAKKYHPDINSDPNATRIMQEINAAYSVLCDPLERQRYDDVLRNDQSERPQQPDNAQAAEAQSSSTEDDRDHPGSRTYTPPDFPVRCQECGTSDATLRVAVFPYVISIVILTFRRAWSGIFCARCSTKKMTAAKLRSFVLGWWGIPFGFFYTLDVLFKPSRGDTPAEANGPFLAALGVYFLETGGVSEAEKALKASLSYQDDPKVVALYYQFFGKRPDLPKKREAGWIGWAIGAVALLIVLVSAITGWLEQPKNSVVAPSPIAAAEPTSHPTAGPFTDTDSLREYLWWVDANYHPFVDAMNVSLTALREQDTLSGQCGVPLHEASALLQEAANQSPPYGLRQTHQDMIRVLQEWRLARSDFAQYCSGTVDAFYNAAARITTIVDLSDGVAEDIGAAIAWLERTQIARPSPTPLVTPRLSKPTPSAGKQNLPSPTVAPRVERIASGLMQGGLRVGNFEWRVEGYTLVNGAKSMEVRMVFGSQGAKVSVSPVFSVVADGLEYSPRAMHIAYWDINRRTFLSVRGVSPDEIVYPGSYTMIIVTFDTPASCLSAGGGTDACMRDKDMSIKWFQYNLTDRLVFRENWD